MRRPKISLVRQIARERIIRLIQHAADICEENPSLSRRYVTLARQVGMRAGVRIPPPQRIFLCKFCSSYLKPGVTARFRMRQERGGYQLVTCLNCGRKKRYPVLKERRRRRKNSGL